MASRRSRPHQSSSSTRTTDEEQILLNRLASKLQQLLPIAAADHHPHSRRVSATNVLEETCRYIRSLNREVDDLSERLSELLPGGTGADAAARAEIIRSLFHGD